MIAILKYNAGNIRSVENAVSRLGYDCVVTDNRDELQAASKVIFPGVGEASAAMAYLKDRYLDELLLSLQQPVLGICLGLQLMCKYSEEGTTDCLGIFDARVKQFPPLDKVPHMGWNNFEKIGGALMKHLNAQDDVYYVHGYYAECCDSTVATCNYILPFGAVMEQDNFYATQFHPEKSAAVGEQILLNFLEL